MFPTTLAADDFTRILELTRAAFRQEADELLTELDCALLELEASPTDVALINRAFRALHTLKGSGATAGFKEVAAVLHHVEDIFNDAREGRVKISSPCIDCVLKTADIVRRMMAASEQDLPGLLGEGMTVVGSLKSLLASAVQGTDVSVQPPTAQESSDGSNPSGLWSIHFRPDPRIFLTGNDPLMILRELLSLGHGVVRAGTERLFAEREIDPELCYLSWEIQLATSETHGRIKDAFLFVEDDSEIRIAPVVPAEAWVLPAGAYFETSTLKDFREEADEDVAEIEAHVLALDQGSADGSHLAGLKRSFHNLKGLSRLLLSDVRRSPPELHPLRAMSELCHSAESFIEAWVNPATARLDQDATEPLLETVDWLKLLLRSFDDASAGWPQELLQKLCATGCDSTEVKLSVASRLGGSHPKMQAVAEQCEEVVRALEAQPLPLVPSPADWQMLSRALDTLEKAATSESAAGVASQLRTLVSICDSNSNQDLGAAPAWEGFRERYRDVSKELERVVAGARPSIAAKPSMRHQGRTISLRPSKPAANVSISLRPSKPAANVSISFRPSKSAANVSPPPQAAAAGTSAPRSVRVDQEKLDRLMGAIGELLVAKNALPVLAERVRTSESQAASKEIKETGDRIAHIADDLQDAMRQIRMMPIRSLFQRFPRMIRDLSRDQNKQVQLIIAGDDTELDKTVLEQIADPLVHLIRNAVDHGIELPEDRLVSGKPEMGTVGLEVVKEGSHVVIRISDNGRGMDPQRLRSKALEKGLLSAAEAAALSDKRALDLIFHPGFSTATKITDISGRGVGMDVVQSNVRQLRGTVSISSEVGRGSVVSIKLPSSLMVTKGILVECGSQQYVIPIEGIREMVKLRRDRMSQFRGVVMTTIRGAVCPVFPLARLLGLEPDSEHEGSGSVAEETNAAIVSTQTGDLAVTVDRLIAEIDVIVKPLGRGLDQLIVFQGATILGDGSVALIVDATKLDTFIGRDGALVDARHESTRAAGTDPGDLRAP